MHLLGLGRIHVIFRFVPTRRIGADRHQCQVGCAQPEDFVNVRRVIGVVGEVYVPIGTTELPPPQRVRLRAKEGAAPRPVPCWSEGDVGAAPMQTVLPVELGHPLEPDAPRQCTDAEACDVT